ncbi:MAG: DUF1638 domain-containing protein [Chitinivibrionales bacterium]|nr:DUF1638 domain-containing protein [Chitinivibrionales bacterium]
MKIRCISCEALARLVYAAAARSRHVVDIELLPIGLHADAADLRRKIQERIDAVAAGSYDAVVLGYGLCGKATAGLTAGSTRLVIPRAHDCITLFLGSRERYNTAFSEHPGTYWYAADYIERGGPQAGAGMALGGTGAEDIEKTYREYVETYGEENAAYLMETMGAWRAHYDRAAFIDCGLGVSPETKHAAQQQARRRGWRFETVPGELVLVRKLLDGTWDQDVLVVEPGRTVRESYDEHVMEARCDTREPHS